MARTKGDAANGRTPSRGRGRGRGLKRPARALEAEGPLGLGALAAELEEVNEEDAGDPTPQVIQNGDVNEVKTPNGKDPKTPRERKDPKDPKTPRESEQKVEDLKVVKEEPETFSQEPELQAEFVETDEPAEFLEKPEQHKNEDAELEDSDSENSDSESGDLEAEPPGSKLSYLMDNDTGVYFTLHSSATSKRSWIHAFQWPNRCIWSRRLSLVEKMALGQGVVAFATRCRLHVFSSGGGYPMFPPLVLEQPLLLLRLQHGFLLQLSLSGEVKLLELAKGRCVTKASLRDLCEPSLIQLDQEALKLSSTGQLSLQIQNRGAQRCLRFDRELQLWMPMADDPERGLVG